VLYWVSEGKTNAEAGQILGIASGTVRVHLEHIYRKLGVENRHGAALRALEKLRG
jgi:DNA-binding CsgD family transcriptional regulator